MTETKDRIASTGGFCTAVKETLEKEKIEKNCCKKAFLVGLSLGESSVYDAGRALRVTFGCRQCTAHFFAGAFLASGSVNSPEKSHHLEMRVTDEETAGFMAETLMKNGLAAKTSVRRSRHIVYFKDGETIFGFLNYIGAKKTAFDYFDVLLERQVRNDVHRKVNFDTANLKKSAAAAVQQLDAIRVLRESGRLDALSDKLRETARLKAENPDANLAELGALHQPPIGKSCVKHRLDKLIAEAKTAEE